MRRVAPQTEVADDATSLGMVSDDDPMAGMSTAEVMAAAVAAVEAKRAQRRRGSFSEMQLHRLALRRTCTFGSRHDLPVISP